MKDIYLSDCLLKGFSKLMRQRGEPNKPNYSYISRLSKWLIAMLLSSRWRETGDGHWTGVMGGRVWTLTQTEDTLWYYVYQNNHTTGSVSKMRSGAECAPEKQLKGVCSVKKEEEEAPIQDSTEEELLRDYFQLNIHLEKLYEDWGHRDTHFRHIASIFTGNMSCSCLCEL